MQQKLIIISLGLLAIVPARPTVAASLIPAVSPFRIYPGFGAPFEAPAAAYAAPPFATPLGNPLGVPLSASPLAVSSSQRLDYFNQFNAAYAPTAPARLLAGPFTGQFPAAPALNRFIQPGRLIAPGVAAPFFF
ncbi:uncharacterized protein [Drosophila kikkawai]|uniref:Uncharacterized protein n=1 Tax=Drosophila kikkawai TaxID=30033 RepID=A0A6P4J501_DROKI|nr:uncharacterized protein LOC108079703 [Drosophila kikkawai]